MNHHEPSQVNAITYVMQKKIYKIMTFFIFMY